MEFVAVLQLGWVFVTHSIRYAACIFIYPVSPFLGYGNDANLQVCVLGKICVGERERGMCVCVIDFSSNVPLC